MTQHVLNFSAELRNSMEDNRSCWKPFGESNNILILRRGLRNCSLPLESAITPITQCHMLRRPKVITIIIIVVLASWSNTNGIFCFLQIQFEEGRVASDLRWYWHI